VPSDDPTIERLEDQINWYDSKSRTCQARFKTFKMFVIAAAALIPFTAGFQAPAWLTGALGALIAVTEGLQQLNQYQANWIAYRSTCEALKHEKFLYLGHAGPYTAVDSHSLLAERIESLVSQEHAKWASSREEGAKPKQPSGLA
jgi:hypothetical protein